MKKYNKKLIKSFGLTLLFIIGFSFFANISYAIAYFEYRNPDGAQTKICKFPDLVTCSSKLKEVCGSDTTARCVSSTEECSYLALSTEPICPSDVNLIDSIKDDSGDGNDYNLLAPIREMTKAPKEMGDYFRTIFELAIGLCAVLAVLMIVIGGVQYMGNESIFGKTEAKSKIAYAIGGLLIALGAYALLNTINPDLLGGKVTIDQVSAEINRTSGGGYFGVTIGTAGDPNANKNITTYDTLLKSASQKYGVECTLIKAFMYAESGGVNGQTSPAGAGGLIQLMPKTFQEQGYDISKIMDPETNIMAGASYLSKLKKNGCNGVSESSICNISNIQYLAASYNGGPGANKESKDCKNSTLWQCTKYDGYKETRIYAPRVEANFNKLKEMGWGC